MMDLAASWAALEREEQRKELERLRERVKDLEEYQPKDSVEEMEGGSKRFSTKRDDWG